MTLEEFLPIATSRQHCGITGSSRDSLLQIYAAAAAEKIESVTRRHITDKTIQVRSPDTEGGEIIRFEAPDVQIPELGLRIAYRAESRGAGFDTPDQYPAAENLPPANFDVGTYAVRVRAGAEGTLFPKLAPGSQYTATLRVGMSLADLPPVFRVVGLFMQREFLDSSSMDALPEGVVENLLRDHLGPPLTGVQMDEIAREENE